MILHGVRPMDTINDSPHSVLTSWESIFIIFLLLFYSGEDIKENTPLVIPLKPNTLVTAERLKEIAVKVESALEEPEIVKKPASPQDNSPKDETLDQMAVRELLQDVKKEVKEETPEMTVPLPAKPVNEGEKEVNS